MRDWENQPAPISQQHRRLHALRVLLAHGIPCILWGEDALKYAHAVPTHLFDQQIITADDHVERAASILQDLNYCRVHDYSVRYDLLEPAGPLEGSPLYPDGVLLQHREIPDEDPSKLWPTPGYIRVLPQSYFGLDTRSRMCFQSIAPPLDSSNAGILIPTYSTFLEGLVQAIMYPPSGNICITSPCMHIIYLDYLLAYREKYDDDLPARKPGTELSAVQRDILSELRGHGAVWYLAKLMWTKHPPSPKEIAEFKGSPEVRTRAFRDRDELVRTGWLLGTAGPAVLSKGLRRYSTANSGIAPAYNPLQRNRSFRSHSSVASGRTSPLLMRLCRTFILR